MDVACVYVHIHNFEDMCFVLAAYIHIPASELAFEEVLEASHITMHVCMHFVESIYAATATKVLPARLCSMHTLCVYIKRAHAPT